MNSYLVHSLSQIESFKDEYEKLLEEPPPEDEEEGNNNPNQGNENSSLESDDSEYESPIDQLNNGATNGIIPTSNSSSKIPKVPSALPRVPSLWRPGKPVTPFPWKTGLVLAVINFNEGFQMSVIAPFAPFLVGYYFGQDSPQLGFYVSSLLSAFFFGQFLTAAPWGRLSDRVGRKPVLLMGLGFSGFSVILFGMGFSFPVVLVARFLGGCLNGNVGITRSYMGEITDRSNQTTGYSVLNVAWTTGSMTGPLIGGFLTNPYDNLPYFDTQFWFDYPYLLPCLFSCIISCLGALLGLCLLSESAVWLASRQKNNFDIILTTTTTSPNNNNNNESVKLSSLVYQKSDLNQLSKNQSFSSTHSSSFNDKLEKIPSTTNLEKIPSTLSHSNNLDNSNHLKNEKQPLLILDSTTTTSEGNQECLFKCFCVSGRSICCEKILRRIILLMPKGIQDRDVVMASLLWALCGSGISMHDAILAVYLQTPIDEGGLGWNVDQIGVLLSIQGVAFVLWQSLFYRVFNQKLGHVGSASAATLALGIYCILLPTTTFIAGVMSTLSIWIIMILLISVRASMGTSQGTAVVTIINNAARPENRGAVNGFAQSIGALMRAIAPLIAGTLYTLSAETGFILAPYTTFLFIAVFFWSSSTFALQLPRTLNAPKIVT